VFTNKNVMDEAADKAPRCRLSQYFLLNENRFGQMQDCIQRARLSKPIRGWKACNAGPSTVFF